MNPILSLLLARFGGELPDTRDDVAPGTYPGPYVVRLSAEGGGEVVEYVATVAGLTVKEDGARSPSLPAADTLAVLLDTGAISPATLAAALSMAGDATKAGKAAVKAAWSAIAEGLPMATVRGGVSLVGVSDVRAVGAHQLAAVAK